MAGRAFDGADDEHSQPQSGLIRRLRVQMVELGRALPYEWKEAIPRALRRNARLWLEVPRAHPLATKLWGGFSRSALAELLALAGNEGEPVKSRVAAEDALASWFAMNEDFATALEHYERREVLAATVPGLTRPMPHALLLCLAGEGERGAGHGRDTQGAARARA